MLSRKINYWCVAIWLIPVFSSSAIFAQNYIINGKLQTENGNTEMKQSIIRSETLLIKDKRVYIKVKLDEGSRNVTDNRYHELFYLLPTEVVYDDARKRIYYYHDDSEYEIARLKSFFGFMPYIALADGVSVVSSPADAKLLVSLNEGEQGIFETIIHAEDNMEETLKKKCGQCHVLEYIYSHKDWTEEDILHAFNRLQMKQKERFTKDEREIIDLFKKYQKGEVDKEKLSKFKSLKKMGQKDVTKITEDIYLHNCVPCHNPAKIKDVSLLYSKRRCKSIVERMKEKEPTLFLGTDMDKLAGYLWEIKLRPFEN